VGSRLRHERFALVGGDVHAVSITSTRGIALGMTVAGASVNLGGTIAPAP